MSIIILCDREVSENIYDLLFAVFYFSPIFDGTHRPSFYACSFEDY